MHQPTLRSALLVGAVSSILAAGAFAQNPNFAPGDLVLAFQNPGGVMNSDKVILFRLPDTALTFRDATSNILGLANVGSTLTSTYGTNWWEANTLYMSIVGVWGTNSFSTTLQNGDPHRTVYVGKERISVGIEGSANSSAPAVANSTEMSSAASNAFTIGNDLETQVMTSFAVFDITSTAFDNQNPFTIAPTPSSPGVQGTAYTVFSGGLQDGFEPGSLGIFGGVAVEAALDLYRLQTRNNIAGQYGNGDPLYTGEYQGTVVIDQGGVVSFIVTPVPEPSALMLLGLAACGFAARRRRPAAS